MDTMVMEHEDVAIPAALRRALNDELRRITLHGARVGAGLAPAPDSPWEQRFAQLVGIIEQARPEKLDPLRRRMRVPFSEYTQRAVYRSFARLDLRDPAALGRLDLGAVHRPALLTLRSAVVPRPTGGARVADDRRPRHTKLELVMRTIRCIDETGNAFVEWIGGADEIYASVVTVDETGDVRGRKPFTLGDFDEGERRTFDEGLHLYTFNLTEGGDHFPKRYTVGLSLIEHDFGNLQEWYDQAIDAVAKYVAEKIGDLVGVAAGTVLGPLAGAFGSLVGAAINYLVDLVKRWLGDEHLGTRTVHATVPSYTARFAGGSTTGPARRLVYRGAEGLYHATVEWRLRA